MSFRAAYAGECDECDHGIKPGQIIRSVGFEVFAHVLCPEDPDPCPRCFTIPTLGGECLCD